MNILACNKLICQVVALLILLLSSCILSSCTTDDDQVSDYTEIREYKVAVILPMENGLNEHWERTLNMCNKNLNKAFQGLPQGVTLQYEFIDESSDDLENIIKKVGSNNDIYAVIGGLYSSNAKIIADRLAKRKPFFTVSTSEQLVRAHASSGSLWAMTETDITQCEVLLTKAAMYGAQSVGLIACGDDLYGKTFIDWFSFQANELGLDVSGLYVYSVENIEQVCKEASLSGADFLICAPSEIEDIQPMIESVNEVQRTQGKAPNMLFSDTAYGADVPCLLGNLSEGLEGVCFSSDPESGFDVAYDVYFNEQPTLGEAQVYDAAMLIAYAAYYQLLHPEYDFKTSMRDIVDGREEVSAGWTAENMRNVIMSIKAGNCPDVRGASGPLNFDSKVYTNVTSTVYTNFLIYHDTYITLDHNTSDGSKRSDATLAGWSWKASKIQEFSEDENRYFSYPKHHENWALLVAGSSGWENYRHQADVLNMYQILKSNGYDDEHIILIVEDDIANNKENTQPGVIQVQIGGENVYKDLEIDYNTSGLLANDIKDILCGNKSDKLPKVIESDGDDNILVFWSGHGKFGQLCWLDSYDGFRTNMVKETFEEMYSKGNYRKMLFLIEACYSGSVAEACVGIPGILCLTAATKNETSKADVYNEELETWMSNRFTSTLHESIISNDNISFRNLYYKLFTNTVGSHVTVFNNENFDNLYTSTINEFIEPQKQ